MDIGLLIAVNEFDVNPATLARKAEELGFESLWFPDHPIMPVRVETPVPEGRTEQETLPEIYLRLGDPLIGLAMAAGATSRIKLGTGVLLVPERGPLVTAKELATLDRLSKGRVLLGIGAGWLREESEIMGVDFARRWTQTREYVSAMRELWSKPAASFDGRYVKFPPVYLNPKPAQAGGIPILLGSKDKNALRWVAQWGDGWCPIFYSPAQMKTELELLRAECARAGRDYQRLDITLFRRELRGERAEVQNGLRLYQEAGINRVVLMQVGLAFNEAEYASRLERLAALYL